MVDINTAMAAASTERRKRGSGEQKERKKNRSGADMGIESFDPVKHVRKEKADTVSMWLVIGFSVTISLLMRYVAMPSSKDNADMLWFLPMAAILLIPSVHRAILPEELVEHYTKGTWFKASFLHIFCWLALTFVLTNAPFGDIVAPQVDEGWGVLSEDDEGMFDFDKSSKGKVTLLDNYSDAASAYWVVLSFSDNNMAGSSDYTITLDGQEVENAWSSDFEGKNESALDDVRAHKDIDYPVAIQLPDDLSVGEHEIVIEVVEDGDPWENTRTVTLTVVVEAVEDASE